MKASKLLSKCLSVLTPPEQLSLSEWFQANIVFSSAASRKAGRFDPTFAPFQKGIMDCATNPFIEKMVVCKSGQSGITTTLLAGMMLYSIFHDPAHILYIRPSNEDVQKFSKKELKNLLDGSPKLRDFFKENKGKESSNTIKQKLFPGGSLTMVGSGSAGALAGFSAKVILIDEVDKMKPIPGVGNVIDLAETRSKTFAGFGRKIIYISTPEVAEMPNTVDDLYQNHSDMRKWFCPCPYCGEYQVLSWSNVKYGHCKETLDDIYLECVNPTCKGHISELQRMPMVRKGEWRVTNFERGRADFPGFHFSDLVSPFSSLKNVVKQWLSIGHDQLKLKNFVNEVLGEAWEEKIENRISNDKLYQRREAYSAPIPYGVLSLTMGVDVQDDRLEYSIWGFGLDEESWLIEHGIISGFPGMDEVWKELQKVINKSYKHECGAELALDIVCIDAGHLSERVYQFCQRKAPKVVPTMGYHGSGAPLIPAKGVPSGHRRVKRFDIGTIEAKDVLFGYLEVETEGAGYVHFSANTDEDWFKQLTAEVPAIRYTSGQKQRYYKQIRDRNEALDCFVYAFAGFRIFTASNRTVLNIRVEQLKYVPPTVDIEPEDISSEVIIEVPSNIVSATLLQQPSTIKIINPEQPRQQQYKIPTQTFRW